MGRIASFSGDRDFFPGPREIRPFRDEVGAGIGLDEPDLSDRLYSSDLRSCGFGLQTRPRVAAGGYLLAGEKQSGHVLRDPRSRHDVRLCHSRKFGGLWLVGSAGSSRGNDRKRHHRDSRI